jgi:hypothetical protein
MKEREPIEFLLPTDAQAILSHVYMSACGGLRQHASYCENNLCLTEVKWGTLFIPLAKFTWALKTERGKHSYRGVSCHSYAKFRAKAVTSFHLHLQPIAISLWTSIFVVEHSEPWKN